jgi:hypothetical protein
MRIEKASPRLELNADQSMKAFFTPDLPFHLRADDEIAIQNKGKNFANATERNFRRITLDTLEKIVDNC